MAVHQINSSVVTVTADIAHDTWLVTKSGAIDPLTRGINAGSDSPSPHHRRQACRTCSAAGMTR
jgi:hypothetical protein